MDFQDALEDRLFNEDRMYTCIKTYSSMKGMNQSSQLFLIKYHISSVLEAIKHQG